MLKCIYWNHIAKYMHYFICKYQYQIVKRMSIKHTNLVTEPILTYVKVTWALSKFYSYTSMSMVIGGIMTLSYWGLCRSFALSWLIVCVLLVFFVFSDISYECFGRWSLLINKGLINLMPRMNVWWFLLRTCNMTAPPSLNLLGEVEVFFFVKC